MTPRREVPKRHKARRTISFRTLFSLLMILVVALQSVMYVSVLRASGGLTNSRASAYARFGLQVNVAGGTLETDMIHRWDSVFQMAEGLEAQVRNVLDEEGVGAADVTLDSDVALRILNEVYPTVAEAASLENEGVFLVLADGGELKAGTSDVGGSARNGLYVRDSDLTYVSPDGSDLLLAAAPISISRGRSIALDSGWSTHFMLPEDKGDCSFYAETIAAANLNPKLPLGDLAHWSVCQNYSGSMRPSLIYSVPLRDSNGVVWGIIGTEITMSTVASELPYVSIDPNNSQAVSLALAMTSGEEANGRATYSLLGVNGASYASYVQDGELSTYTKGGMRYVDSTNPGVKGRALVAVSPLKIYERRSPYSNESWAVVGFESENLMFADVNSLTHKIGAATLVAFAAGVAAMVIIGRMFDTRVKGIASATHSFSLDAPLSIERTGIVEFDELASSLEQYSRSTIDSLNRLARITRLSGRLASAFERVSRDPDLYLFTDSFAELLDLERMPDVPSDVVQRLKAGSPLGSDDLRAIEKSVMPCAQSVTIGDDSIEAMIHIPTSGRWVSMTITRGEGNIPEDGYFVDATEEMAVRHRLENERDYDLLTGLINRRAFESKAADMLEEHLSGAATDEKGMDEKGADQKGADEKCCAMVMLDLDNLKSVNDTYGHDMGDLYIKATATQLKSMRRAGTLVARISGDEFMMLVTSYATRGEVLASLSALQARMRDDSIRVAENDTRNLLCSIGVAFVPEGGSTFAELKSHADEAMYEAKRLGKNSIHVYGVAC